MSNAHLVTVVGEFPRDRRCVLRNSKIAFGSMHPKVDSLEKVYQTTPTVPHRLPVPEVAEPIRRQQDLPCTGLRESMDLWLEHAALVSCSKQLYLRSYSEFQECLTDPVL